MNGYLRLPGHNQHPQGGIRDCIAAVAVVASLALNHDDSTLSSQRTNKNVNRARKPR